MRPVHHDVNTDTDWLDPDEFPFTEAELTLALKPYASLPGFQDLARIMAEGLREVRDHNQRASAALARGSRNPEEINTGVYIFPEFVLALLAELSPGHAERVESLRRERRRSTRPQRLRSAMYRDGHHPSTPPVPDIEAAIDAEDHDEERRWQALCLQVRRGTFGGTGGSDQPIDIT